MLLASRNTPTLREGGAWSKRDKLKRIVTVTIMALTNISLAVVITGQTSRKLLGFTLQTTLASVSGKTSS